MKIPSKFRFGVIIALCLVVGACSVLIYGNRSAGKYYIPENIDALLALSNEEIKSVDIAVINLLCAEGLPGAENIDIEYCLKTLDEWAEHVLETEEKYKPAFYRNPAKYDNSYALFQGVYLNLALELDYKCGYNMKQVESGAMADLTSLRMFADSKDLFMQNLDAVGELVISLEQRAACLRWHKRYKEACVVYEEIQRRMPHVESNRLKLEYVRKRCGP